MKLLTILLQHFDRVRDYFLPHEVAKNGDIDVAYRFRLLAEMIIICMIVIGFFAVYYPCITHFSWPGSIFSSSFSVILLSFHAFLLLRLRQQKNHERTAHWLLASVFLAINFGIIITGGVLNSLTPVFLPLPIIMAFLLINKRTGLIYSAITFVFYITLASLSYWGLQFPQTIPLNNTDDVEILLWMFFSITMLALILAYDGLSTKLMHQLRFEQEKQAYLATHDSLTDLANRQKFDQQLNEALHRSSRLGNSVTLLIIDLNKFKPINDSFGHDAGDAILVHVAQQIASTIRTDDLAARIGGDEFAVILQGDKTIKDINALMGRLTKQISLPLRYKNKILTVTASIGIASYPDQTKTEEDLRKAADTAMYAAKKKGKDWVFFNESLDNE